MNIDAYLYIYNEVFVKDWNRYVKKMKADSYFIKSKWIQVVSEPANDVSLETVDSMFKFFSNEIGMLLATTRYESYQYLTESGFLPIVKIAQDYAVLLLERTKLCSLVVKYYLLPQTLLTT